MAIVKVFSTLVETGVHGLGTWCGKERPVQRRSAVLSAVVVVQSALSLAAPPVEPSSSTEVRQATGGTTAPPDGAPPEVRAADPKWNEREQPASAQLEPAAGQERSDITVALGAQVFGVSGKAMSGLSLRIGRELYWGELEFSPVWLTQSSSEFNGHFLGNQWGFYFSLAPLRTRQVEVLLGIGADVYHLWEIHGDEVLAALAVRAQSHFHITEHATVFFNLRSYALHSEGLELGVRRDTSKYVPVLGALGAEWRFE